jgi:hypothetical protein
MIDPQNSVEITDGRKTRWVRPGTESDYPGWHVVGKQPVQVTMRPPATKTAVSAEKTDSPKPTLEE